MVSAAPILTICSIAGTHVLRAPSIIVVSGGTNSSPNFARTVIILFFSSAVNDLILLSQSRTDSANAELDLVLDTNDRNPVVGPIFNLPQTLMTRWILLFRSIKALTAALPPALVPTRDTLSPFFTNLSIIFTSRFNFDRNDSSPSRHLTEYTIGSSP